MRTRILVPFRRARALAERWRRVWEREVREGERAQKQVTKRSSWVVWERAGVREVRTWAPVPSVKVMGVEVVMSVDGSVVRWVGKVVSWYWERVCSHRVAMSGESCCIAAWS